MCGLVDLGRMVSANGEGWRLFFFTIISVSFLAYFFPSHRCSEMDNPAFGQPHSQNASDIGSPFSYYLSDLGKG